MTHDDEDLRSLIAHLRQEIEALPPTAEGRARMSDLAAQLEAHLAEEEAEEDLGDRISEAIARWEAEHPRATAALNRIANLLSGAGV